MMRRLVMAALACLALPRGTSAQDGVPGVVRSSGLITVRGVPHPYVSEGVGEPCIVAGLATGAPALFSARLKQHIRFIYVDFKKSWGAEPNQSVDNVTMDTLVDEIDQVRRAFQLERTCLVAHSTPGLVAIEYGLRYPERVSRLALIAVPPFNGPELMSARRAFWDADASPERKARQAEAITRMPDSTLKSLSPRDAFSLRYVRTGPRYFYDATYDFSWAWIGLHYSAEMLSRYFAVIVGNFDPSARLAASPVPTFVALGRYDYAVPYHLWDDLRDRMPHVTYALFERSAHFPMLEESRAFDDRLIRWLGRPP